MTYLSLFAWLEYCVYLIDEFAINIVEDNLDNYPWSPWLLSKNKGPCTVDP